MKTVQEGGTPNLVPLPKSSSVSKGQPATAPSLPPVQTQIPIQKPEIPSVPPIEPISQNLPKTYSGDFSERMKETHASTATVLAAEQDSASVLVQSSSQQSSHNSLPYVIAGVVLLVAGSAGAYVAYTHYMTASAPIVLSPSVSAPIFVDDREQVSGTGTALLQAIEQSVNRPLASGTVRLLYSASTTNTVSIFSALHASAPDILLRNVQAEGSMAGVVHVAGSQSPFFILSVVSYSNTFSGMLSWETSMLRDLSVLFPAYPAAILDIVATSTTATTTVKNTKKAATTTLPTLAIALAFHDEVVANHDVRIYRDAAGQSVLLYGYWNQTTLVIARDPVAFTEIVQRLGTSRTP
jgi:hypothetical protein